MGRKYDAQEGLPDTGQPMDAPERAGDRIAEGKIARIKAQSRPSAANGDELAEIIRRARREWS
jgi:hypothetical protein